MSGSWNLGCHIAAELYTCFGTIGSLNIDVEACDEVNVGMHLGCEMVLADDLEVGTVGSQLCHLNGGASNVLYGRYQVFAGHVRDGLLFDSMS
eukprot:1981868-Amphidinium_carterae.1